MHTLLAPHHTTCTPHAPRHTTSLHSAAVLFGDGTFIAPYWLEGTDFLVQAAMTDTLELSAHCIIACINARLQQAQAVAQAVAVAVAVAQAVA